MYGLLSFDKSPAINGFRTKLVWISGYVSRKENSQKERTNFCLPFRYWWQSFRLELWDILRCVSNAPHCWWSFCKWFFCKMQWISNCFGGSITKFRLDNECYSRSHLSYMRRTQRTLSVRYDIWYILLQSMDSCRNSMLINLIEHVIGHLNCW